MSRPVTRLEFDRARFVVIVRVYLSIFASLVLVSCSALAPEFRIDLASDVSGTVSAEFAEAGIADIPVQISLAALRDELQRVGLTAEVARTQRGATSRSALRVAFKDAAELRRVLQATVPIPESLRASIPGPIRYLVPREVPLTSHVDVSVKDSLLSRSYSLRLTIHPALRQTLDLAGMTLRVHMPGVVVSTNGRRVEEDVVWPADSEWPSELFVESETGIMGTARELASRLTVLVIILASVAALGLLARRRLRRPSRRLNDQDEYEYGVDNE